MAQPQPWMRDAQRGAFLEHLKAIRAEDRVIAAALRDAAIDAERKIKAIIGDNVSASVRRAQFRTLTLGLRENQAALWGTITSATRDGIQRATVAAAEGNLALAEYLTAAGAPALLADQFMLAARHSVNRVRAKIISQVDLSPLVYKNRELGIRKAQRLVTRGIAQNLSAREIAGSVRHLINPNTPGGVSYAAMRLARTEINNSFHALNTEWHADSPFVEGVKWELSNSHPRPDECDDYAEQDAYRLGPGVWKPEDVPHKPHPHCLCYTVAVTVKPNEFVNRLMGGAYDPWLQSQGFLGVAA